VEALDTVWQLAQQLAVERWMMKIWPTFSMLDVIVFAHHSWVV
jgi:hypothetical protein